MRQRFTTQPEFGLTPIEQIVLPLKSRDELPPILAGKKATGRTDLDLWQILVLGVVRLGLDANYDRLEHLANYDTLIRQFLGVPAAPTGAVCPAPGFFGKSEGARLAVRAISGERP